MRGSGGGFFFFFFSLEEAECSEATQIAWKFRYERAIYLECLTELVDTRKI